MLAKLNKRINIVAVIFFGCLSAFFIFQWYKDGYMYGGGDVGLPEYNPIKIYNIIKIIWWNQSGTGFLRPYSNTGIPIYLILSALQQIGLSYVNIQMIVFGFSLFGMGFGMFLVAKREFGKSEILAILSGYVYMINPFMFVVIWHRFVRNGIYFAAILPFLFIFWTRWVEKKDYLSLFIFLLINVIFSFVFAALGYTITLWILLGLYTVSKAIFPYKNFQDLRILLVRLFVGIMAWIGVSIWWISSLLLSGPSLAYSQHTMRESILNFMDISSQQILPYSIAGLSSFYLYEEAEFGEIYFSYLLRVIPFFLVILALFGVIHVMKIRKSNFFGILFILAVLLIKGSSPPFGNLFLKIYESSFAFGVIRNPFEKIGILYAFSYSILISYSVLFLVEKFKNRNSRLIELTSVSIIVLSLGIFAKPMFIGEVFGVSNNQPMVDVPKEYLEANSAINNDGDDGRILHLPLTLGDGIRYNWKVGYNGLEPSDLLFDKPSIAHALGYDITDDYIDGIEYIFRESKYDPAIIENYFVKLGIKYIILHKDVDWISGQWESPTKLQEILNRDLVFNKIYENDLLTVYKFETSVNPRIYFTQNVVGVNFTNKTKYWPWKYLNNEFAEQSSLLNEVGKIDQVLLTSISEINNYQSAKLDNFESGLSVLPYTRFLPESSFYKLILIKENINRLTWPSIDRFWFELTITGKRVVENYRLALKGGQLSQNDLNRLNKQYEKLYISFYERKGELRPDDRIHVLRLMIAQLEVLQETEKLLIDKSSKDDLTKLIAEYRNWLADNQLYPYYYVDLKDPIVYRFKVEVSGNYEIVNYDFKLDKIFLNGEQLTSNQVFLDEGFWEIAIPNTYQSIDTGEFSQIVLNSRTNSLIEYNFDQGEYDPDSSYLIYLKYSPIHGTGPVVEVLSDSDPIDVKDISQRIRVLKTQYAIDGYNFDEYEHSLIFKPRPNSSNIKLRISEREWNNCEMVFSKKRCEDEEIYKSFNRVSEVQLKDFSLKKLQNNPILLMKMAESADSKIIPVEFEQSDAVSFKGRFKTDAPGFLVFSETYFPQWELKLTNKNNAKVTSKILHNLFANSWYLDSGEYEFEINFIAQEIVEKAKWITGASLLFFGAIALLKIRNEKNN